MKNKRGLLAALRTNPENLSTKRLQKLDEYLKQQPVIDLIYQFKQQLRSLLMQKTLQARRCKQIIPEFLNMIKALKQGPFKRLATLGKTLCQGVRR